MRALLVMASLMVLSSCLFSDTSAVIKLNSENFDRLVLESDEVWMVEFFAPWCGHCKRSAADFEKAAEILKGIINVGAVDMTTDQSIGHKYGISSYPTIKIFGRNKTKPYEYLEPKRTFDSFVNFSLGRVRSEIVSRIQDISKIQSRSKVSLDLQINNGRVVENEL